VRESEEAVSWQRCLRSIIVDVQTDDGIPEGITIELEDGTKLRLRLADSVSRDDWDREHFDGHRRTRTTFFLTHEERPGEFVAIELSE